jgi:hypothetical protein
MNLIALLLIYLLSPVVLAGPYEYHNTFVEEYESAGVEVPLDSLQCPIPIKDRVRNYTGIQCVYSSIEMLGRWAEEPKLMNPPITSRPDCKGYSGPSRAAEILNKMGVRFEQSYGDKERGRNLLRKAMREGRGALWDVPGHAMVIVHYNEEEDRVCWVDNSDRTLKVQETNIKGFERRWGSWILVIYADNDIVPDKMEFLSMSVLDRDDPSVKIERGFVPMPD